MTQAEQPSENGAIDRTTRESLSACPATQFDAALTTEVTEALALFRVIFSSVRRHNRFIEDRCGLGAMQLRALAIVCARPRIGVSALAAAMFIHQPTASKLIESMATTGLVRRERSKVDGRAVELLITSEGRAVLSKAPEPVLGVLPDGLGALKPAMLQRLTHGLHCLLGEMRLKDDAARFEPLTDTD